MGASSRDDTENSSEFKAVLGGGCGEGELRVWTLSSRPVGPGSAEWSHQWSSFSLTKKWGDLPQEALKRTHLRGILKAFRHLPPRPTAIPPSTACSSEAGLSRNGSRSRENPSCQSCSCAAPRLCDTCIQMDTLTLAAATEVLCGPCWAWAWLDYHGGAGVAAIWCGRWWLTGG